MIRVVENIRLGVITFFIVSYNYFSKFSITISITVTFQIFNYNFHYNYNYR